MENRKKMEQMLRLREKYYKAYITYEKYVRCFLKFAGTMLVMFLLTGKFGYPSQTTGIMINIGISVISCFLPMGIVTALVMLTGILQIYYVAPIFAAIAAVSCIVLYLMLLRYTEETVFLAVLIPVSILWHVPVLPVIVAGLFFSPACVLSVGSGVIVYYLLAAVKQCEYMIKDGAELLSIYQKVMDLFMKNPSMYIMLFALSVVLLVVYGMRRMKAPYSFEISIALGALGYAVILLLGTLVLKGDFSILAIWLGAIVSGILALAIQWMHMILDYGEVEDVQFEDEEYYYYVHAVPKLRVPGETGASSTAQVEKQNNWDIRIKD